MMLTYRQLSVFLVLLVAGLLSACDVFEAEPTLTPIYVTATPDFVIVTNTPTPSPTPVLAPTLDTSGGTSVGVDATAAPPSPTATTLITVTPTFTPTPTNTAAQRGVSAFLPVGADPDDEPPDVGSVFIQSGCSVSPQGGFATIYNNNPALASQLSCPISGASTVASAYQPFERGLMIWVASQGSSPQSAIFALYGSNVYQGFSDTWREGDPVSGGQQPPAANLIEPIRGFGKIWRESGSVRDGIGWATGGESGGNAVIQAFERGTMIYLPQTGQTYILITGAPGSWSSASIAY